MARIIHSRLYLSGQLVTQTPLHVGGFGEDVDTDLPLARDGAGRYYIPGTSLAGALREWCRTRFGDGLVKEVWGYQEGDRGHASYVAVENTEVPENVLTEVRDGVGIDRVWGCAAEHIKYDRAILPRGTRLELEISVDTKRDDSRPLAMLLALKKALENEEVRLGAAKTRGLGRVKLEGATLTQTIFDQRPEIFKLLRNESSTDIPEEDLKKAVVVLSPNRHPRLAITIDWQPIGPLMVKAGFDGIAVDMLPLVSGIDNGKLTPVLPGSGTKGALRQQAERIVCTLLNIEPAKEQNPRKKFLFNCDVPLVEALFGARGRSKPLQNGKKERGKNIVKRPTDYERQLGRGALGVDDCYAKAPLRLNANEWKAIIEAHETKDTTGNVTKSAEKSLREALETGRVSNWQQAFHVAIDRWTGGAADGFLYSVLEPHSVKWESITLHVDLARLPRQDGEKPTFDDRLPALMLLFLVLRDLASERIPLGFGTNRGLGCVQVNEIVVKGTDLDGDLSALNTETHLKVENGKLTGLKEDLSTKLKEAWSAWVNGDQQGSHGASLVVGPSGEEKP